MEHPLDGKILPGLLTGAMENHRPCPSKRHLAGDRENLTAQKMSVDVTLFHVFSSPNGCYFSFFSRTSNDETPIPINFPSSSTVQGAVGVFGSSLGPSFLEDWDPEVLKNRAGSRMSGTNIYACVFVFDE